MLISLFEFKLKLVDMLNFNKPTLIFMISLIFVLNKSESKLVWKVKPEPFQIANEHDDVRINCEFEDQDKSLGQSNQYFVIWYKDGSSQNVLALNEKLANVNSSNYEIIGKYNLVIKNVSKSNSGLYTCQLFQSNDLISSVNLTVLGNKLFLIQSSIDHDLSMKETRSSKQINCYFLFFFVLFMINYCEEIKNRFLMEY